ncbi:hypothetical protein [Ochrobactrum sp. BTU1]|uniref:hypothetical protein n=1 Tax=Ochrobactrum sp. BTU1 TaxID=2840456 RepID=UPI001C0565BB|nr:hypothetical protein KMS41_04995 [Ochrobactrum sp. BTU1]
MTKTIFKAGDRVRRLRCNNTHQMPVGSEWTISDFRPDGYFLVEGSFPYGCDPKYFELVVPAKKPQPNLKANFSIPRDILTQAAEAYVKEVYGVTLASAKLPYGTALVPLHAEVAAR